ncbi:MAG: hypothetical protein ACE5GX_11535 [Thermoanaerobaculia bacterium]
MWPWRLAALTVALALQLSAAEAANVATWRRNVDAIVRDVIAYHPEPFAKTGELVFRRAATALKGSLPDLNEEQRVVALMRLVASLGDGHTQVQLQNDRYSSWYPVRLFDFSDGYFITSAHKSVRDLTGAEVLTIAGRPVGEVVDAARSLFGADNKFDRQERLYAVHNAFLMRGLGFAREDGSLEIEVRLRNGQQAKRVLRAHETDGRYREGVPIFEWQYRAEVYGLPFGADEEWFSAYGDLPSSSFEVKDLNRPPFLQQRTDYTRRWLPAQSLYYIQMNHTDDSGMLPFVTEALREVDTHRPRYFVLDLRFNFGGDGSLVSQMIHQFIYREVDQPWGDLYLVTGRKSYSAAVMVIDAFRDHTEVSLVGEPPGAALNSFGDPESFPYPELGLSVSISTLRHQLGSSADLRPSIPIDFPALMSFQDYAAGRDPVLEGLLSGDDMRSIARVARVDGGGAARTAFLARKKRFGRLSWWTPPSEVSLRRACDALIEVQRFDDALDTCTLNTEIHPFVWNTWYNLGYAQYMAEVGEERYRSYQCVVELVPTNWNVPSILELFEERGVEPESAPGCPVGI